jgi:hypothetical protein
MTVATLSRPNRWALESYYSLMDSGRVHEVATMFVDDVKLTFGNAEPVYEPEPGVRQDADQAGRGPWLNSDGMFVRQRLDGGINLAEL